MDPRIAQLLRMYQGSHQGQPYPGIQQGGMFGGGQPQGQMPQQQTMQQPQPQQGMPAMQPTDGQLPAAGQKQHHGGLGGILPYLGFGLLGGSLLSGNTGAMAPMFGLAGLLGHKVFK